MKQLVCFCIIVLFTVNCAPQASPFSKNALTLNPTNPLPLSLKNPRFQSCYYHPPIKIAHFSMQHYPSFRSSNHNQQLIERVASSQFQLLHTILSYRAQIVVFDEHAIKDTFTGTVFANLQRGIDSTTTETLDGRTYQLQSLYEQARNLFPQGVQQYYEHLNSQQKTFLAEQGGSVTAFLLGEIPKIYKVIKYEDFQIALSYINSLAQSHGGLNELFQLPNNKTRDYWVYHFREEKAFFEVVNFYENNPNYNGLVLIAYGSNHDFSNEFQGYPFDNGKNCPSYFENPPQLF